jgi:predicted glutamine amidotransferase
MVSVVGHVRVTREPCPSAETVYGRGMCRLFGLHAGATDVDATFWLLDAPSSLAHQSHANPDGFGLATFCAGGEPSLLRRPVRAAGDEEFCRQARETHAATFLAHVRYADTGEISEDNTHPFTMDRRAFAHNGVVGSLDWLDERLGEDRRRVAGQTDSERVFALMTQAIAQHGGDIRAGITAATTELAEHVELYSINFLLCTPDELWALRYPEHNELYVLERAAGGPRGAHHLDEASAYGTLRVRSLEGTSRPVVVVASEPMDEDPGWRPVAPGELVRVGPDLAVTRELILPDPPRHPMVLSGRAVESQAQEHR